MRSGDVATGVAMSVRGGGVRGAGRPRGLGVGNRLRAPASATSSTGLSGARTRTKVCEGEGGSEDALISAPSAIGGSENGFSTAVSLEGLPELGAEGERLLGGFSDGMTAKYSCEASAVCFPSSRSPRRLACCDCLRDEKKLATSPKMELEFALRDSRASLRRCRSAISHWRRFYNVGEVSFHFSR
jgi:hypothetical protein